MAEIVFTKDFLSKVFKKYDPNYELIDFTIGSSPHDSHLASDVKYLIVKYTNEKAEEKSGSYVVKVPPSTNGLKKEITEGSYAFENEMTMYGEILPKMQEILKKADMELCIPKLIYQTNDPVTVMIFEDVRSLEYESSNFMIDSIDEFKMVITQLARFHASSYFLSKNGEDLSMFAKTFYYVAPKEVINKFIGNNFKFVSEIAKEWQDEPEIMAKMEILKDNYLNKLRKVFEPNKESHGYFNVLNHADFHYKNLMFRKNNVGKLENVMMIDFQACQFCSPAIDVIFMTNAIAPLQKGLQWQSEAISFYHKEFTSTLKKIGFTGPIPSLLDLQIELLKHGFFDVALRVSFTHFAFIDLTTITPETFCLTFMPPGMDKPEYREAIKKLLKNFNYKGLLD